MGRQLAYFVLSAVMAAACGGDGSGDRPDAGAAIDAASSIDARPLADAPPAIDAEVTYDARPAALGCLGEDIPTSAPNPLTITGEVYRPGIPGVSQDTPIQGATVEAFMRGNEDSAIAGDTTDTAGNFTLSTDSGGEPVNAYLRASANQHWTTYLYPPTPAYENLSGVQVVMTTDTQVTLLSNLASVSFDTTKGWVSLLVLDCDDNPIEGATVSSSPAAGSIAYSDDMGIPSTSETHTNGDGLAMLFNVPTGTVTLTAEVNGMTLRSHDVEVHPTSEKQMITTAIVP